MTSTMSTRQSILLPDMPPLPVSNSNGYLSLDDHRLLAALPKQEANFITTMLVTALLSRDDLPFAPRKHNYEKHPAVI